MTTNLVDEPCDKCKSEQTEIQAALSFRGKKWNMFRCVKCKKQHMKERTPEQRELVKKFVTPDKLKSD